MLKEEFEKLTGKQVTDATFNAFNEAYMESDLTKEAFCKSVKKAVKEKPHWIIGVDFCADKKSVYTLHVFNVLKNGNREEIGAFGNDAEFQAFSGASYLEFSKFVY